MNIKKLAAAMAMALSVAGAASAGQLSIITDISDPASRKRCAN